MKSKYKLLRYFLLGFFVIGASLILGFLSYGGMYAMLPVLLANASPATASILTILLPCLSFFFTVIYEAQIYLQHLSHGLHKLFAKDYLSITYAKKFLATHTPDTTDPHCPQFFKEYEQDILALKKYQAFLKHYKKGEYIVPPGRDKKYCEAKIVQLEKAIYKKEKWFAKELSKKSALSFSYYSKEVQDWINALPTKKGLSARQVQHQKLAITKLDFNMALGFSIFASIFFTIGTTYLLLNAFASIPALAALPFLTSPLFLLPIGAIAGIAWGLLIYNTVTNFIQQKTIQRWLQNIKDVWNEGMSIKTAAILSLTLILTSLTISLTVFTAGTWYSLVHETQALFSFMQYAPIQTGFAYALAFINGLSECFFAIGNNIETLEIIREKIYSLALIMKNEGLFVHIKQEMQATLHKLQKKENWLQILNPFRLLYLLLFHSLRIILFIAHIWGVAVSADRVPYIEPWILTISEFFSELAQDIHFFLIEHAHTKFNNILKDYFHKEEHDHDHSDNIPDRILRFVLSVTLHPFAALVDFAASLWDNRSGKKDYSLKDAFYKQQGKKVPTPIQKAPPTLPPESPAWQLERAHARIAKEKAKYEKKRVSSFAYVHKLATLDKELGQAINTSPQDLRTAQRSIRKAKAASTHSSGFFAPAAKIQKHFFDRLQKEVGLTP